MGLNNDFKRKKEVLHDFKKLINSLSSPCISSYFPPVIKILINICQKMPNCKFPCDRSRPLSRRIWWAMIWRRRGRAQCAHFIGPFFADCARVSETGNTRRRPYFPQAYLRCSWLTRSRKHCLSDWVQIVIMNLLFSSMISIRKKLWCFIKSNKLAWSPIYWID